MLKILERELKSHKKLLKLNALLHQSCDFCPLAAF